MGVQIDNTNDDGVDALEFMLPVSHYVQQITENWKKSLESVLNVARLLVEAEQKLNKKEWRTLVKELPFSKSITSRLLSVGKDKRITDPVHLSILPFSYATLYEISLLTDDEFKKAKCQGILNQRVYRKTIADFKNEERGIVPNQKNEFPENEKFAIIYINPNEVDLSNIEEEVLLKFLNTKGVRIELTNFWDKFDKAQARIVEKEYREEFLLPARKELRKFVKTKRKELKKKTPGKKFAEIGWMEIDDMLEIGINTLDHETLEEYLVLFDLWDTTPQLAMTCHRLVA